MAKTQTALVVPDETLMTKIYIIRGKKVMLDSDLAELYGVSTGNLNKAVARNIKRFPEDFMFDLTKTEYSSLRFQIGILKRGQHTKYLPKVFTREGISMLSGLLNSDRAIRVNIQIMRTFWKMEDMLLTHKDILKKLTELEKKLLKSNTRTKKSEEDIQRIFIVLQQLLEPPQEPRKQIGYKLPKKK
ncbi:MAG: ORF6N domain-containing protein [Bacteroidia bacterium]|nr:ORF6N domain-containing protein [Bacteroidia bacterium]